MSGPVSGGTILIEGSAGIGKTRLLVGGRPARDRGRRAGALGQGQRAGAGLRLRHRAAAVRAVAGGTGATRHPAGRRGGRRPRGVRRGQRRRPRRRVVRRPARLVLADRQPHVRRPAAAGDRRRAVVRQRVAAIPGLPGEADRGPADPGGDDGADRRPAGHRRPARASCSSSRSTPCCVRRRCPPRRPGRSSAAGSPPPTTPSCRPVTAPRPATRCCCDSWCGPWSPRA